jgi:hypothetical protein
METISYPVLSAADWSWENVEGALTGYLKRQDGTIENVFIHNPVNPGKVMDEELNDELYADIDRSTGYTEKEVRFILDVTFDQLQGDSLQFTRIELSK